MNLFRISRNGAPDKRDAAKIFSLEEHGRSQLQTQRSVMTRYIHPKRRRRRELSPAARRYDNPGGGAQELEAIIAARPFPPLTVRQMREKWLGVFEPEFWDEVLRASRSRKTQSSS
jgi:hypothetical protein